MWSNARIMRQAERTLKRTKFYLDSRTASTNPEDNFQLDYVLVKKYKSIPDIGIAYAHYVDEIIKFDPFKENAAAQAVPDWSFSFDTNLFYHLEDGYDLVGMPLPVHGEVWAEIAYYKPDDILSSKGIQQYLHFCKRNGITADRLRKEVHYKGMDVMTLYDKSAFRREPSQNHER